MTIRRNWQVLPAKQIILTCNSPILPCRIKAEYLICPVRSHIANPLCCFKREQYGHTATICRGSVSHLHYTEADQDDKSCENSEQSKNCQDDHPAYSCF